MASSKNWITVAESGFPWEREALEFVRTQFPSHEPYRAWSNFEFVADDGSINEVDLLVFTPQGFFLIEIKSRPGRLSGDANTWTWETQGKPTATIDNPLLLANSKAKKLRSLLNRQKACKGKGEVPWIDAIVFCSAADLKLDLQGNAAFGVRLRDTDNRPGIMGLIRRRECPGIRDRPHDLFNKPAAKIAAQAIEQAGIRQSQRMRKVSDYLLDNLINDGPGFQDWQATHTTLKSIRRRVRIYNVRTGASEDERRTIERAASREAELLETLQHPGILRREGFTEHELGPALIFEHDPLSIRLDHFMAQRNDSLGFEQRLDLMRQIAEVVRFAHKKRVIHRSLCPQSILVIANEDRFQIKVFNWQVGYRTSTATTEVSRPVTATSHVDRLVEDVSTAYMAPEAISETANANPDVGGEHLDIFSLGAIAFHLFSGTAPAANGLELSSKLRETGGLQISSVLNGASQALQELVQWSTLADVSKRVAVVSTADDFLDLLEKVEAEAATPDHDHYEEDPNRARAGDLLPGDFRVIKRLGQGGCSIALLVEKDAEEFVLKVSSEPGNNSRLRDEADVLQKSEMRHPHIVEVRGTLEIGDRFAFLMRPVFSNKENRTIETLRDRLRQEGRLHIDLLQRFGEDLLEVVKHLEENAGLPHRDLKPDNIAIGQIKRGDKLHLVLFDFSLSRANASNIRAGTTGYLDPMLPLRADKRWDLHGDRYAAAATLYEMAAGPGNLPIWGDGASDPSHLDCEARIDGEFFDPSLRDSLTEFFERAFRRDPTKRFDNSEVMLQSWRDCFVGIEEPGELSDHNDDEELRKLLESTTFDTPIPNLKLGPRAANALDRANILTVRDLLTGPIRRLARLRGVGNKTRREIVAAARILRERLGKPHDSETDIPDLGPEVSDGDSLPDNLSVDLVARRILPAGSRQSDADRAVLLVMLGIRDSGPTPSNGHTKTTPAILETVWPSQADVADSLGESRTSVAEIVGKFQTRLAKDAVVNKLRGDIAELIQSAGGVMSVAELADSILIARGSVQDEPERTRLASAVARACVEVELSMSAPRFVVSRDQGRIVVAIDTVLAGYAFQLGNVADHLAGLDPLVPPARAIQRLREVEPPATALLLSDSRILRLAVAVSTRAAVSSRQEIYLRGLEAARALRLSQGALYGVPTLTIDQIRNRVQGRYPESESLPGRPGLDELLASAGFDFRWDSTGRGGGCYVNRLRDALSITSGSGSQSRLPTGSGGGPTEVTPEIADARQFEERLDRAIKDGSFLALMVNPKNYQQAAKELCNRYPVQLIDLEGLFIDALRDVATQAKVQWDLVLKTDAKPGDGDWDKLMLLVGRVMPIVERQLFAADRTILLIYSGLLARYDQMTLLEQLRDRVGRKDGVPGVWMLIPGDQQATMDGKTIPLISPGQRTRIPEAWIQNIHRSSNSHSTKGAGVS